MNKIVMTLAGLLLIVAAGLKFHEMLTTCVPAWRENPTGFWESYEFFLIQIPLEFALGLWLLSGLFRKAAWIAGTLAYLGFIGVTFFKARAGLESCGCFGRIQMDPWMTLYAVDIPFFLLLAVFSPRDCKLFPPPWPNPFYMLTIAVPVLAVMALAAPAMLAFRPDCIKVEPDPKPDMDVRLRLELSQLKQQLNQQIQQNNELTRKTADLQEQLRIQKNINQQLRQVLVEPSTEQPQPPKDNPDAEAASPPPAQPDTSQTTPPTEQSAAVEQWEWLPFVVEEDIRRRLTEGLVVVLMYHHDCPTCAEMAPKYSEFYNQMAEQGDNAFTIAFLAIPPYGEDGPVPAETTCLLGTLTDAQKWQVMSPFVVALLDGELIKSWPPGTAPEPDNILDEIFGQ